MPPRTPPPNDRAVRVAPDAPVKLAPLPVGRRAVRVPPDAPVKVAPLPVGLRAVRVPPDAPVKVAPLPVGQRVAALASRQHGVVAARQLNAIGLAQQTIADWVAAGHLHPVYRGVYAVGHTVLGQHGQWMAAVLAGGRRAVLSHASAAALWDLRRTSAVHVDVSVRRSGRTKRRGLRLHFPR